MAVRADSARRSALQLLQRDVEDIIAMDQGVGQRVAVESSEREKEVLLRTPVMIGTDQVPPVMNTEPVRYRKNQVLGPRTLTQAGISTAMAIRMPHVGIIEYVQEHLQWLPLHSDEELVDRLEDRLLEREDLRVLKPTRSLRVVDLVAGPLFSRLNP